MSLFDDMNTFSRPYGAGEPIFQLTDASVSPTRIVGRDKYGAPIEETICMLAVRADFLDAAGNVVTCALNNTRVRLKSSEADRYTTDQIKMLLEAGCVPVEACCYGLEYRHVIGSINDGRIVPLPAGVQACDGRKKPENWPLGVVFCGCEHNIALRAERLARTRQRYEDGEAMAHQMSPQQITNFATALAGGLKRAEMREVRYEDEAPTTKGKR